MEDISTKCTWPVVLNLWVVADPQNGGQSKGVKVAALYDTLGEGGHKMGQLGGGVGVAVVPPPKKKQVENHCTGTPY